MVAQPGIYIASNNAGELAPELHGRTDLKQYYSGLAKAINIEPVPQGGSRLLPRTRYLGTIRRTLAALSTASTTTSLGPHSAAATVKSLAFSQAQPVSRVVVTGFKATQALSQLMQVQTTADGANWSDFGNPINVGVDAQDRAVALAPGASVSATGVRLRLVSAPPSATTFTVGGFTAYKDDVALSDVRLRPFTFAIDQTYVAALTADNADLFRDGSYVGNAKLGITAAQLADFDTVQRLDSLFVFHPDVQSLRVIRDGSDHDWPVDTIPFINIPKVDLGGSYADTIDTWTFEINYQAGDASNTRTYYTVNGEQTTVLTSGGQFASYAADLKAAIEALAAVGPGITVTVVAVESTRATVKVEFTGALNAGQVFVVAATGVALVSSIVTIHSPLGEKGGEDLISPSAGWPACAGFAQDRLIVGGFKAKRGAFCASVTGEYFDLNTRITAASGAILNNLDTDGAERLQKITRARHPVLFTSEAEYFISTRPLDRTQPVNVVNFSRNGSARGVPIIESEGTLLYLTPDRATDERSGVLLYAMAYDDVAQAYISSPLSLLAAHIVSGITDMGLQKSQSATAANRLWMRRNDGGMTVGVMIRNQEVTAFVQWKTSGQVRAICVDGANVPYIAVERSVGMTQEIHLERIEDGLLFDGTVEQHFDPPTATITGLSMHEGAEVWADADGFIVGPFNVAGGAIELPFKAANVSVGRWTPPDAELLPLPSEVAERTVIRRPKRVHAVRLDLIGTTSLAVGANGEDAEDVPLAFAGAETDAPPAPFTGRRDVEGLVGYSDTGTVRITQVRPGTLQWRGITVEARL